MKEEYIIISKTAIEKRIAELEKQLNTLEHTSKEEIHAQGYLSGKIQQLRETLSQSTPLIPEIEKVWEDGNTPKLGEFAHLIDDEIRKQDYITNLKLDI